MSDISVIIREQADRIEALEASIRHSISIGDRLVKGEQVPRDEIRAARQEQDRLLSDCKHEWVSADNAVVTGGEVCLKCGAIQATSDSKTGADNE